jgi:predicted small lipoprotein YifL
MSGRGRTIAAVAVAALVLTLAACGNSPTSATKSTK